MKSESTDNENGFTTIHRGGKRFCVMGYALPEGNGGGIFRNPSESDMIDRDYRKGLMWISNEKRLQV